MNILKKANKRVIWIFIFLLGISQNALAQRVAFSFDDGLDPTKQTNAEKWNKAILTQLSQAKIRSIFYVTGRRVDSKKGLSLVSNWSENGHWVANHSYSHRNFSSDDVSLNVFTKDVEKNERLLQNIPSWTKRFRFPYLKEGKTTKKRDQLRAWLTGHEYQTGAVSIDTSDWYYNIRYLAWIKQHPNASTSKIRTVYLDHLWDRANYYDALPQKLLNRSPDHVLLLHTNAINAAFLKDVITMFRKRGWDIIDPERAYRDPLYAMKTDTLPAGESIIWSLAKQNKFESLRYPAEDGVYEKTTLDVLGL